MTALSHEIAAEFCRLCSWAHEVWTLHRALFDDNPDIARFKGSAHEFFLHRLSTITQEYAERIRPARNKTLAHNDLAALLAAKPLGGFPADADKDYFAVLQEFVNLVYDKAVGGPYPFAEHARTDAHVMLKALATGEAAG